MHEETNSGTAAGTNSPIRVNLLIGELLKRQREVMGLSQQEIGSQAGYPRGNLVGMIEGGRCVIPLSKVSQFTAAYCFHPEFSLVLIKYLHPGVWSDIPGATEEHQGLSFAKDEMNRRVDDVFRKSLECHGLTTFFRT